MLDNVGLVHMNGRVYDPTLGRFLSADPLVGDLRDSQSVNPYAYAGNRPLSAIDPTGFAYIPLPDGCGGICASVVVSVVHSVFNFMGLGGNSPPPPPPATALPGQSAQSGTGLCGPGTFSPVCSGMVLYAGAPATGAGGPGTSTWASTSAENPYAQENLERFFVDLGVNAVHVLILSPVDNAAGAYDAARAGNYVQAVVYVGFTACDVAKQCMAMKGPLRGIARMAKSKQELIPRELARVVAGSREIKTLGRPDADDVFVVAADDIAGMNASELADRLTIPDSGVFTVIRFPTPTSGLASPVFRSNPGFVPGGLTRGGAREYVIPNGPIPAGAKVEVIGK
jgi:RHS repeat-associated protein